MDFHSETATLHSIWEQDIYIGSLVITEYHEEGGLWLSSMFVHRQFRRQGYGKALLLQAIQQHRHKDIWIYPQPWADQEVTSEQLFQFTKSAVSFTHKAD